MPADDLLTDTVDCATCKGLASLPGGPCQACDGRGTLLVVAPPIACPRCKGSGEASAEDSLSLSKNCLACRGTGWSRIIWDEPNRLFTSTH